MIKSGEVPVTPWLGRAIGTTMAMAALMHYEFAVPELFLTNAMNQKPFQIAMTDDVIDKNKLNQKLNNYLVAQERVTGDDEKTETRFSEQLQELFTNGLNIALKSGEKLLDVPHMVRAMFDLKESMAAFCLKTTVNDEDKFINKLSEAYSRFSASEEAPNDSQMTLMREEETEEGETTNEDTPWKQLVTNINDILDSHNPLIGREAELDRTIQILCRKEKNNPLHIGDPGVGKTSLVYGLAKRIKAGNVPPRLQRCKIYQMDMSTLLAGAQFRGDFEKRLKTVMDGATEEGNVIIYLDEIHNIIGAGTTSDGGPDASNMLKPYLEAGNIRFIGSTTYDEYNRHMSRSKGIVRRFQQIDIQEPSIETTIEIVRGLKKQYETYHNVRYRPGTLEYAVRASAKYIHDRHLPDKAIDLIDEAGAFLELHPNQATNQFVTKGIIDQILQKVCKIDAKAMKEESNESLQTLNKRISAKIFGQDPAVRQIVEAVQMAKAGLLDEQKPLANLLFVGPTGVGKTEVAKVLAQELGIELVRFDMSEYTEKHTVAKLIGSPAGYVGYEDGGLLTDAIRKTPNCVLLLDEIEKAHADIYNILLQVMDYAKLTDNRGQKADFRNTILIMTSNAGAQFASQSNIGFAGRTTRGEAMLKQIKRTFKPEFINRLSSIVVFNEMSQQMAQLILQKKLDILQQMLSAKKITMEITPEANEHLLAQGFTPEYGAREMERIINNELKPLFVHEILFGKLRKGGVATVEAVNNKLRLKIG